MGNSPRPEYPRPQFVREPWINLNGEWQFEIDSGNSGIDRKLHLSKKLKGRINVPFCPESRLSGVEYRDFMPAVWYRKEFEIPKEWAGKHVILHFGAVDYLTRVWVNGNAVGSHRGGYTPFSFDITEYLLPENNSVTVCAQDDTRSGRQPRGKQSSGFFSWGCSYTRTTGIWQTVWLECVSETYINRVRIIPDPENGCVHLEAGFSSGSDGLCWRASAFLDNEPVGTGEIIVTGARSFQTVKLSKISLWEPGKPNLYRLELVLLRGREHRDSVSSYFGLRSISLSDHAILLNGKPVFQRLVLDQGFYPDGIYTAPTDRDLKRDIEISMAMGFNGARMHQKVFEPRYLYWADRMGYLIWGESASWGLDITTAAGLEAFLPEWMESVERDFSSPALIGWCPFNETWDDDGNKQDDEVLRITYLVTKAIDHTRPVIDTSGFFHVATDIFDVHCYEQDPEKFSALFEGMKQGGDPPVFFPERQSYGGQPYFVSEYGGIWWNQDKGEKTTWGYGKRPADKTEFLKRYQRLTETLLNNPRICAFCYTQLFDVEQETNGLYTYDRTAKFDPEQIRRINIKPAAIELPSTLDRVVKLE